MSLVSEVSALAARIRTEVNSIKTSLASKAPLASPAFTGTPTGITKTHVGLGNVDNTSDANKPVSTAQQTALDGKVSDTGDTMTGPLVVPSLRMPPTVGTASGRFGGLPGTEAWVGMFVNAAFSGTGWNLDDTSKPGWFFKLDSRSSSPEFAVYRIPSGPNPHTDEVPLFKVNTTGLTTVAGRVTGVSDATATTDAVPLAQVQSLLAGKAPLASPAFTGTPTGITQAHVGLGNVNNTSDANKPVSTLQQTALDGKEGKLAAAASPTTTFLRGDKTWAVPPGEPDTGWTTSGVAFATGDFTDSSSAYRVVGDVVEVSVNGTYVGANLTIATNGNTTDTALFTIPATARPGRSQFGIGLHSGSAGLRIAVNVSGQVLIVGGDSGVGSIANGQSLIGTITYIRS